MSVNESAFLSTIKFSELGADVIAGSQNGYNVVVGSTPEHIVTFPSYADHPRILVHLKGENSTAAGAYQILAHIFDSYKASLRLPDFSPASQDAIAMQILKERRALDPINAGDFDTAILRCSNIWASLPGATYGQHVQKFSDLRAAYQRAGGTIATGVA
jgi:muramidase (phage lysozyme)